MHQGEAMMPKRWQSPLPKQRNGHRRDAPVEPLSARIVRLRIARGYSAYELATAADVFAGTIKSLESGKPADKRVLPALARALDCLFADSCAESTTASNERASRHGRSHATVAALLIVNEPINCAAKLAGLLCCSSLRS